MHATVLPLLRQNTVYLFLPPEQHSLLNQLLLELQTLIQGPHLALHVRSLLLPQIPAEEQARQRMHSAHHYREQTSATPATAVQMVQSNFLRAHNAAGIQMGEIEE